MCWGYDEPYTNALKLANRRLQKDLRAKPHAIQMLVPNRLTPEEAAKWGMEWGSAADICPVEVHFDAYTHWVWLTQKSWDEHEHNSRIWNDIMPDHEKLIYKRFVQKDLDRYEKDVADYVAPYLNDN